MRTIKPRILCTSSLTAFALFGGAAPAFAQNNDAQPATAGAQAPAATQPTADADQGQAIVITGSRIPQPNLTAVSPVTVVGAADIRLQGFTRTEDVINALPQAFADQGGNLANGASGTATVDLRGLRPARTLVLVDGRRLVPGDPLTPFADINFIPTTLISRVDVLTGGASSVYGADAVAGVVNFVMDTHFTGIRMDAQYSFYQHDNDTHNGIINALNARGFSYPTGSTADGGTYDLNLAMGAAFDDNRGHVVAYAGWRRLNPVTQGRRDYSACTAQANAVPTNNATPLFICGGSLTAQNATIINGTSTLYQVGPNRTLTQNLARYNFAPTNYYQRPDERYVAGAFADYEISPALHPYMEFMFMDDRTVAQIAPSGDFGNTFSVNCDNPLLSAQQRSIICAPANLLTEPEQRGFTPGAVSTTGLPPQVFIDPSTGLPYFRGFAQILRRNVEGGNRQDDRQHTDFRIVTGMRGDLSPAWSYDLYYQFGRSNFSDTYSNEFSVTRLLNALDVVDDPRVAGVQPVCRSAVTGADPTCVPYDIWSPGQVTPAALAYLQTPGFQRATLEETVASASLTGNLGDWGLKFPWAASGVGIAIGAEYRKESLDLQTDAAFSLLPSSDLAGQGAPTLPTQGSFDVRELYGEVRIPIVERGFLYNFSLEGGFRYSSYHYDARDVSTNTFKLGADLTPVRGVRFRAAFNRAVRTPNIQELFSPQRVVLNGAGDPCSGGAPDASLAACQAMGVTAVQYGRIAGNPAGQYNGLVGGVRTLDPETADTITLGVVLQPSFIPHLALTVDWFDIRIKNAIQKIGQDSILAACVQNQDPFVCGLVHRDATGSLWRSAQGYVIDLPRNIGGFSTRGIDVSASYAMEIGRFGGLTFNMNGTWVDQVRIDSGVSEPWDCAGLYGAVCSSLTGPNPTWRHRARLTWTLPDGIGVSAQWRYFSAVRLDRSTDQASLTGAFAPFNARIPAQSYFDLTLTARIGDHYNFRLGVNNILDREPPIFGSNGTSTVINACALPFCNGNTYPNVYDSMGRYIFAGVSLDF